MIKKRFSAKIKIFILIVIILCLLFIIILFNFQNKDSLAYFNKSMNFDGKNHFEINRIVQDDFTISFWIKTKQTSGFGNWYNGVGLVDAEVSGVTNDFGTAILGNKFAFGTGSPDITLISRINISDNKWHHCVAIRKKLSGDMAIYVDGIFQSKTNGTKESLTAPQKIKFGSLQTDIYYFYGTLKNIRIYDKTLSSFDIKKIYFFEKYLI